MKRQFEELIRPVFRGLTFRQLSRLARDARFTRRIRIRRENPPRPATRPAKIAFKLVHPIACVLQFVVFGVVAAGFAHGIFRFVFFHFPRERGRQINFLIVR